ncbi:hypothetical protein E4T56_gene724 [Termitomyces sp. T112]|nr:hypothetical protein E4T56_gene724 [Termitomyces sp. T112]
MVCPGLYWEVVAAYAAANPTQPFVAQFGANLEIRQVHVPDNQVRNFTNDDAIHVLIHNRIPPDWVDHAYTYGMRLAVYGTPPAIPNWDGWQEISEEDHYRLLFKRADKMAAQQDPKATGLLLYWNGPKCGSLVEENTGTWYNANATAAGGPLTPKDGIRASPSCD